MLGLKPAGGDSKKAQLKWIEQHLELEKKGYAFTIKKIITKDIQPKPTRGGANNVLEYRDNLEKLILDILAQPKNSGKIFISKNRFFYALEMVNINYIDHRHEIPSLSKYLEISEPEIREWLDATRGVLERSLESALTSLRNKALIIWSKEITVHKLIEVEGSEVIVPITNTDEEGRERIRYEIVRKTIPVTREATDEEKKYILAVEREMLDKFECENKSVVIQRKLWSEFNKAVIEKLKSKYKILYYYNSYKILSNPEDIQDQWRRMNFLLDKETRREEQIITNSSIIERLEDNAESRQKRAIEELENTNAIYYYDDKLFTRANEDYLKNHSKLSQTLINLNEPSIKDKLT